MTGQVICWDRGRPRPPVAQKASGRKLFVLRTRAGGAPAVPANHLIAATQLQRQRRSQ
jgi:hypothetical protein